MFKGFDQVDNIQYIYTSVEESLCGVTLDAKNKVQYLLSGNDSVICVRALYMCRSAWVSWTQVE